MDADPSLCHRCGSLLRAGRGEFWLVHIDAVADPSPPDVDEAAGEAPEDMSALVESMRDLSERELMDQVHRRLRLTLCNRCFARWIERPTG